MELTWILAVLFVGLLSLVSVVLRNIKLSGISYLLLSILLLFSAGAINSSIVYGNFLFIASAAITLTFLLSDWPFLNKWWAKLIVLLVPFLVLVLLAERMSHGEYELDPREGSTMILLLFSMVAPFVMIKKIELFQKWFVTNEKSLQASLELFMVGFLFFLSNFLFSAPGVVLAAAGFTIGSNLLGDRFSKTNIVLLLLSLFFPLMDSAGLTEVDLSLGKVILGLFFGAFLTAFVSAYDDEKSKNPWGLIFPILMLLGISTLMVFLGTQKADLGGFDAFLGLIAGSSLSLLTTRSNALAVTVVSFLLLAGFMTLPLVDPTQQSMEVDYKTEKQEKIQSVFDQAVHTTLNGLVGTYEVDKSAFKLTFELGPKGGRTKGAFKDIQGEVSFSDKMSRSSFAIELPVISLTTFNKFRDESLMSKEYFDQEKFNVMSFSSVGMMEEGGRILLNGKFIMLGVEKEQIVEMKYLGEKDGAPVFIGRGVIDRRDFGMRSDPKEGNVVDFEFEIRLNKK